MKSILFLLLFSPFFAFAQNIDVKDVKADGAEESTTTIEIRKGKAAQTATDNKWEITEGDADISGDVAPVTKEARSNWKKACDDWKKEFREDNKENKIITINCGNPACSGEAGNKVCTSKAVYKLKTRVN